MSFIKYLMEVDAEQQLREPIKIQVPGIGVVTLEQAQRRAVEMFSDLAQRVQQPHPDWYTIRDLLSKGALQAYVDALVKATHIPTDVHPH